MGRCIDLYDRVQQLEVDWLGNDIQKRIISSITASLLLAREPVDEQDQSNERRAAGEKFLTVLREAWEDHQLCMGMITDVFMYMVCWQSFQSIYGCGAAVGANTRLDIVGPSDHERTSEAVYLRRSNGLVPRVRITVESARGL